MQKEKNIHKEAFHCFRMKNTRYEQQDASDGRIERMIHYFLKNKANLLKRKFDISSFLTSVYEKFGDSPAVKNKAKQTQFKANLSVIA